VREIPCDAKRVLKVVCQECHASPPRNQAPFALVTYADTQALIGGMPIWTYMRSVLENGAMPLPPVKIDPADRDILLRWLGEGAPTSLASGPCLPIVDSNGGNETEGGPLSAANDGDTAESDAAVVTSSPDAGGASGEDAIDAGEEMNVGTTPAADGAAESGAIEACCSNDGSAASE
ncbi:MAG TPA: hypothetical protein VGY54_04125, partial [Polyangiaceae bacterium]|nr:hypothetical protein [Polyangiaceae bacterium]